MIKMDSFEILEIQKKLNSNPMCILLNYESVFFFLNNYKSVFNINK